MTTITSRNANRNSKGVQTSATAKRSKKVASASTKVKRKLVGAGTGMSVLTDAPTKQNIHSDSLLFKTDDGVVVKVTHELVTPEIADEWLKLNTRNRMLDDRLVKSLAKKMKKNHWMFNGDTIRFSKKFKQEDGSVSEVLMDGQNRLNAIIASGKSLHCLVIRGLNPDSFATMDDGRKRSASDILSIAGIEEPRKKAGIAKTAILIANGYYGSTKGGGDRSATPGNLEVLDFVRAHDNALQEAIEVANDVKRDFPYIDFKMLSSMYYVFGKHGKTEAKEFYKELRMNKKAETPVVRLFCVEMAKNANRDNKIPYNMILAYFIKTWNAFKEGSTFEKLSYDKTVESFPKPL